MIYDHLHKRHAGGLPISGYSKTTHFRARTNAIFTAIFMLALTLMCIAIILCNLLDSDKIGLIAVLTVWMFFLAYFCIERAIYYFKISSTQVITAPDGLHIYGYAACDFRKIKGEEELAKCFRKRTNEWIHLTWAQIFRMERLRLNQGTGSALIVHTTTNGCIILDLDCFPMRITAEISKYKQVEEIYSINECRRPHTHSHSTPKKHKRRKS